MRIDDFFAAIEPLHTQENFRRITGWLYNPPSEAEVIQRIQTAAALPSLLDNLADGIEFTGPVAAREQIRALAARLRAGFPEKEILP